MTKYFFTSYFGIIPKEGEEVIGEKEESAFTTISIKSPMKVV